MFKGKVVAFALMLVFATSIYAGNVDDCESDVGIVGCTTMTLDICPAGDFELISEACDLPGAPVEGAYLWIIARDSGGNPIPGIPWTDYWLGSCDPDNLLCLCANPINADSLTGENGRTTFSARVVRGGSCSLEDGIWWAIQGKIVQNEACDADTCLSIEIKSIDLTGNTITGDGDCICDISDLAVFGWSYNTVLGGEKPGFNPCCDYNEDDACDVSDFAYFAQHYQHRCQ
jgi:hypothetical protein